MSEGLGSALGELGQRRVSGLGSVWRRVCVQRVSVCLGSDLRRGGWEDWTLVLWRLRGDCRLKKEKRAALHSGQFPLPKLLFFSIGARTSLPPTTAGIVILLGRGEYSDSGDLF